MASIEDFADLLGRSENYDDDFVTPQVALEMVQRARSLGVRVLGIDLIRILDDGSVQPDMGEAYILKTMRLNRCREEHRAFGPNMRFLQRDGQDQRMCIWK